MSEFLFRELGLKTNLQTSEGRAKLVSDAKPLLQQVAAPALSLMLVRRLVELSGINQGELEELLQIKRAPRVSATKNAPRKQPSTPYRWLILMLLYSPNYIAKLDRDLLVQCSENTEEVAALKTLVNFLDVHSYLIDSKSGSSILTYLQNSPYRALLESIESETLEWSNTAELEAEFWGIRNITASTTQETHD